MQKSNNKKYYAKISGTGSFLPPNKYTTADLKKYFPQIDLDENEKTIGVKTRYFVRHFDSNQISHTNSELTCEAAKIALLDAKLDISDIDLIVTTTASPDYSIPNMACQVQEKLGAENAAAIGILSGCGGFTYALTIATQFIENGFCKRALVTGSEVLSPYLDFSHDKCREGQALNSTIFGDGAGAFVLKSSQEEEGILLNVIGSDGRKNPLFMHIGGSKSRPSEEAIKNGLHFWDLNFRSIISYTPKFMSRATAEILTKSGLRIEDINWVIPHQPTLPMVRHFAKKINFPFERVIMHFEDIGDIADGCLPISFDRAKKEGRFKKGDLILLVAAGAGWMYGANLIKW